VIVSLLYKVARKLLSVPGVLLRSDTSQAAEVLVPRHGNAVLRRQIAGSVRYGPADRFWLAALSSLIPRRRRPALFPVTPGTLLAWHRKFIAAKWDYSARRVRAGRPPTGAALKKPVLRLARENAQWGPPAYPGRARPAGPPHRRVHRVGDPAHRGHRPGPAPHRPDPARVPHKSG
jgi:hypothetical protein